MRVAMFAVLIAVLLSGCESMSHTCPAGLAPMTEAQLFFGRSISGGATVGDADWRRFVEEEIAPRFPAGFTVTDGDGQWRDQSGTVLREASKEVTIVLTGASGEDAKLAAIRGAYRTRFHQESVLLTERSVCGSF